MFKYILIFLLAIGAFFAFRMPRTHPLEVFPMYAGCANGHDGTIRWRGQVLVHERFYTALGLATKPEDAVREQLRYLNGYYNYGSRFTPEFHIVPLFENEIHITGVEKTTYGKNLTLDVRTDHPSLRVQNFIPGGKVQSSDAAYLINYEASQKVILCHQDEKRVEIPIELPRDPYLAFWNVAIANRKPIRYGSILKTTNPCADPQWVELPFPSMYWYLWDPDKTGLAEDGSAFRCPDLLKTADLRASTGFTNTPEATQRVSFKELEQIGKIQMKIIFGLVSEQSDQKSVEDAYRFLKNSKTNELQKQDPAVGALLELIHALQKNLKLESNEIELASDHVLLNLKGELFRSKKEIEIEIFLGSTDEPQKKAKHWSFLRQALETSPIVFYVGHSGMGQNMNIDTLIKYTHADPTSFQKQKYQLLGIVSCFENSYFNDKYTQMRKSAHHTSDTILTAQGGYPYLLPAHFLEYLDSSFTQSNTSLAKRLTQGLQPKDVIIYRRY